MPVGALGMSVGVNRWVGRPVLRREDERFLRGAGRFVGDVVFADELHVRFIRSHLASAAIEGIDADEALSMRGVVGVYNYRDFPMGPLPPFLWDTPPQALVEAVKPEMRPCHPPLLSSGRVTYVGQAVAVVVAESRYIAEDAVELVNVAYNEMPAVVSIEDSLRSTAPVVHPGWDDNVAVQLKVIKGNPAAAFEAAEVVTRGRFEIQRQAGVPLEPRGAVAEYDTRSGRLTLWSSTQNVHPLKRALGRVSGLPSDRIRVIAPDVGGGFGVKGVLYPEDLIVGLLARRLQRPIKWIEDRMEHMLSATHARDQVHEIELALSASGRILALRDQFFVDCGAYNPLGLVIPYNTLSHLTGPYHITSMEVVATAVITNKVPTAPYRGAGRPEAVFALERAIERSARDLNLDPLEIRMRNLIRPEEMPNSANILYRDGNPLVLDSGDYPKTLAKAAELIQSPSSVAATTEARSRGLAVGIGYACYVEGTGIGPFEGAVVNVGADGKIVARTGASSQGQGHETVFAQICADQLGVPLSNVTIVAGDTDQIERGWGTVASRSAVVAGNAVADAAVALRGKCLKLGAAALASSVDDVELVGDEIRVAASPERVVALGALAECALEAAEPLEETSYYEPSTVTWSHGAHAVSVAIDEATGKISILRYVVVHDCGTVINPMIVEGQIHGAVAQGIGGALYEEILYDREGQLLNPTLAGYIVPSAVEIPDLIVEHFESPSPLNRLGIKGMGEGGAVAPPAAIANAVDAALPGARRPPDRTPLSPQFIWEMLQP